MRSGCRGLCLGAAGRFGFAGEAWIWDALGRVRSHWARVLGVGVVRLGLGSQVGASVLGELQAGHTAEVQGLVGRPVVDNDAAAAVVVVVAAAVAAERHLNPLHTQTELKEDRARAPMRVEAPVAPAGLEVDSYMFFVLDLALGTHTPMFEKGPV